MQLTSLLTAAGLAVSASNAFLVPSAEQFSEGDDVVTTLPVPVNPDEPFSIDAAVLSEFHTILLDCPGCPVPFRGRHKGPGFSPSRTSIPSHLELNFTIEHGVDSDRLMANGFQLYPMRNPLEMMSDSFKARLLPSRRPHHKDEHRPNDRHMNKDGRKKHHRPHHNRPLSALGFGLSASQVAKSTDDKLDLVLVDLDIIEVGRVFVELPRVEVNLVQGAGGSLMMGKIDIKPVEKSVNKGEECTDLLCKMRKMAKEQLSRLPFAKGCHGRPSGRPHQFQGTPDGAFRPTHGHAMHHMHHGHRAHWGHFLKRIASHILLPIAIGIMAGVLGSVLGMVVGTIVVYVYRTFFRRSTHRHRQCRSRAASSAHKADKTEVAAAADEEKAGLMVQQDAEEADAPPAYVDDEKKPEDVV